MRYATVIVPLFTACISMVTASPTPAWVDTPMMLWNGVADVPAHTYSEISANDQVFPKLRRRLDVGDQVNCKGSSFCELLGGPSGTCEAASRRIDVGNSFSTTGGSGRTGVCSGTCGIFVKGDNCEVSGATLLESYNAIRSHGCSDCGRLDFATGGCEVRIDRVTGC